MLTFREKVMEKVTAKFNASILVVDDYLINQEMTKEMLEMMGCQVDVAEDGQEALDLCKNHSYDLIFMDIQMPKLDGVAATHAIRQQEGNRKHTPIIALTANALTGDREKYLEAGLDDYLSKPIRMKDLENMLKKHLAVKN